MATYIPNATQTTEPVESRTVESAALEFRTLKTSINARIDGVQEGLDTEIVNRITGDVNLQTQNNAQDIRLLAIENALLSIGEGGLPGTVYVQRFSGTGAQTAFTLTAAPRSENVVDIYINGIYQNKNTFSVAGAVITFSEAPPAGADNIEVQVTVTIALGETDASLVTYNATTVEAQLDAVSAAGGSNLVGFQQAGTGAVVRTAQAKMREFVTVADFGVLGNGTNETSKVQAALNYLNSIGGGELRFSGEVVRCDSPLVGYSNTKIIGTPGSTIDWSHRAAPFAAPTNPGSEGLLVFRGTASAEILLAADAVYKTNKINVPDASLFAEGDLVEISMDAQGSFPDTSVATKSGQLNILNGVFTGTNNLVLDTVIFEPLNYTTANGARIRKITPVENIVIEGMTFKGVGRPATNISGDFGVRIFFGRNVTVRNCNFIKLDGRALEAVSCHHFVFDSNEFYHDKLGNDNSIVSYSLVYTTSQYGTIKNNKITNSRHGIVSSHLSAGLANKYYGISRFILIEGNSVTGNYGDINSGGWAAAHAGISTHSDAEFLEITNNIVSGCKFGINPRTWNISITGNTLVGNDSAAIYLSANYRDLLISNNYISGGSIAIAVQSSTASSAHPNLRIIGNTFESTGAVSITVSPSSISAGLDISNNQMVNYAGNSSTGTIILNGAFTGKIQNNIIDNATVPGLSLDNTRGLLVSGNHIYRTNQPISVQTTCQKTVIVNNIFINNTNAMSAPAASQSVVSGNHDFGTGAL